MLVRAEREVTAPAELRARMAQNAADLVLVYGARC